MTRQRSAIAAREYREAIVEPLIHADHAERHDARGRQFERERNAVEPPADFADEPQFGAVRATSRCIELARSRNGLTAERCRMSHQAAGLRHVERLDREDTASRHDPQRLAARYEHAQIRVDGNQYFDGFGDVLDHVFGVVEHEQTASGAAPKRDLREARRGVFDRQSASLRDGGGQHRRARTRRASRVRRTRPDP